MPKVPEKKKTEKIPSFHPELPALSEDTLILFVNSLFENNTEPKKLTPEKMLILPYIEKLLELREFHVVSRSVKDLVAQREYTKQIIQMDDDLDKMRDNLKKLQGLSEEIIHSVEMAIARNTIPEIEGESYAVLKKISEVKNKVTVLLKKKGGKENVRRAN